MLTCLFPSYTGYYHIRGSQAQDLGCTEVPVSVPGTELGTVSGSASHQLCDLESVTCVLVSSSSNVMRKDHHTFI